MISCIKRPKPSGAGSKREIAEFYPRALRRTAKYMVFYILKCLVLIFLLHFID